MIINTIVKLIKSKPVIKTRYYSIIEKLQDPLSVAGTIMFLPSLAYFVTVGDTGIWANVLAIWNGLIASVLWFSGMISSFLISAGMLVEDVEDLVFLEDITDADEE